MKALPIKEGFADTFHRLLRELQELGNIEHMLVPADIFLPKKNPVKEGKQEVGTMEVSSLLWLHRLLLLKDFPWENWRWSVWGSAQRRVQG